MDYEALIDLLQTKGYCCTETAVRFGLGMRNEENEQLCKASAALCGGMQSGKACGALTGGAILLGMYDVPPTVSPMVAELVNWFDETYGMSFGSIECTDIAGDSKQYKNERCKPLIKAVCLKCAEILTSHGYIK